MRGRRGELLQLWREPPAAATKRAHRLSTGLFFSAGGIIVLLGSIWIDNPEANVPGVVTAGVAALGSGLLVLWLGERVPTASYHVIAVVATAMVTFAVLAGGGGPTSFTIGSMYLFVIVDAVFLFSLRAALFHATLALACTVGANIHAGAGTGDIIMLGGCVSVMGIMAAWLARTSNAAERDPLTGLFNRRGFDRRVDEALQRVRRDGGQLVMAVLDVDHFRTVNESQGHLGGDRLLQAVGVAWLSMLEEGTILSRYGGDEFALLMPGTSLGDAATFADMLRLSAPEGITISAGVAGWEPGDSASTLFHKADLALFDAKTSGRDRSVVYGDPSRSSSELERAIANGEMRLYLQPIVQLGTREVLSYESLIRWAHPRRGLLGPAEFVPQAERTGAVHSMGLWALREAARLVAEAPDPKPRIGVNVSVVQLRNESFPSVVREVIRAYGIPALNLCIEVTESVFDDDEGVVAGVMRDLAELGVRIAIDDFGSGYWSLGRLANVHADFLKLDGTLVSLIRDDTDEAPILEAIVTLGHNLGMRVLAEKVETEHQAGVLRRLGFDLGQGFLFGRPASAEEVLGRRIANPEVPEPGTKVLNVPNHLP